MKWVERFKQRKAARKSNPEHPTNLEVAEITRSKVSSLTQKIIADDHEERIVKAGAAISGMHSLTRAVKGMATIMEKDGGQFSSGGR